MAIRWIIAFVEQPVAIAVAASLNCAQQCGPDHGANLVAERKSYQRSFLVPNAGVVRE